MILGWAKIILPQLYSMGKLEAVEHEVTLHDSTGQLCMMTQPDVLIEPHDSDELVYVEWKTTKQPSRGWFMHWTTAPQFMAAALAVKETLNRNVGLYQVVGLVKGDWRDGWQHSPFCWGWRYLQNNGSYDYAWAWEDARRKGWERFQIPESMIEWWVENMPQDILIKQFPQTLPMPVDFTSLTRKPIFWIVYHGTGNTGECGYMVHCIREPREELQFIAGYYKKLVFLGGYVLSFLFGLRSFRIQRRYVKIRSRMMIAYAVFY